MTHISKKWIEPEIWQYITDTLTYLVKEINDTQDVKEFLSSVLTDTERLMISKRVVTAFLLRHNMSTENICEVLKITPATVTRQKMWIQLHEKGFDLIFDKLEKRRKGDIAKDTLYKILDYAIRASSGSVAAITKKQFK